MTLRYLRLNSGETLPELKDISPFKSVVIVDEIVDPQWQAKTSRWLADSGCRYMMAWGKDCSSWDTSIDLANLEQFDYGDIPDEAYIMTTWHDDEPLAHVIWFAKMVAYHADLNIDNLLFLHIGSIDRQDDLEALYSNA